MFDYRPYIIAIAAIFLALASGILIGITFGEDVLVSNQKEMIEFMQQEIKDLQENFAFQQDELKRWEGLAPLVIKSFQGALTGHKILILTVDNPLAMDIVDMLSESGAEARLVELPSTLPEKWELDARTAQAIAGELTGEQEATGCADLGCSLQGVVSGRPDCFLIYLSLSSRELAPGHLLLKLLGEELLQTNNRVIAAFPEDREPGQLFSAGKGMVIIDHLDSFWGKLTLLETLLGGAESVYSEGGGWPVWK